MKKYAKKCISIVAILFCCYCIVDAIVETQQETFPVKAEEIDEIRIAFPNEGYIVGHYDSSGEKVSNKMIYCKDAFHSEQLIDSTRRYTIANLINTSPMYLDEAAKLEMVSDFSFSPYDKNVVAKLELEYERNFLQRKYGTIFYFYDDGMICVNELQSANKPLLIRFINQWNRKNWESYEIYAIDDMDVYDRVISALKIY